MPDKYYIVPAERSSGGDVDNTLPGEPVYPSHGLPGGGGNITLPVLPGIWPPPGKPNLPVDPGWGHTPGHPGGGPIILPIPPGNATLPVLPGIWPPLPPDLGVAGKTAILVWVVKVGYRWFIYEAPPMPEPK